MSLIVAFAAAAAGLLGSCGSDKSDESDARAACMQFCAKNKECNPETAAFIGDCTTVCNQPSNNNGNSSSPPQMR